MINEQTPKYRYPGVNSFTQDDADIFCGRADDGEKLHMQIMLSKTVVLHAESGTGKSSLVNAGLLPIIKTENPEYIPLYIRFKGTRKKEGKTLDINEEGDNVLVYEIFKVLRLVEQFKATGLPLIKQEQNDLWYEAKLYQANNKCLLFIFDQFEDLQIYSYKQIQRFKEELALLFSSAIPKKYYESLVKNTPAFVNDPEGEIEFRKTYNNVIKILREPLNARALFVIREDKLGTLSLLSDCFPDILKNDYQLLPLTYENAWKAIEEPAKKEGDHFISPPFKFQNEAIAYILENLSKTASNRFDPIEIQIICMFIENSVHEEASKATSLSHELIITKDKLPLIKDIITTFYYSCWEKVKSKLMIPEAEYHRKRHLIIDELIFDEKRIQVFGGFFSADTVDILEELVHTGLLRRIPINYDIWYQLSHDKLVKPAIEDLTKLKAKEEAEVKTEEARLEAERKAKEAAKEAELTRIEAERKEKEAAAEKERIILWSKLEAEGEKKRMVLLQAKARKRSLIALSILTTILSACLFAALILRDRANEATAKAEEQQYLITSQALKHSNPTLSYLIARDGLKKERNPIDSEYVNYLRAFDSADYSYMIGSYKQIAPPIISAHYLEQKQETLVTDNLYVYFWGSDNFLKEQKFVSNNRTIVKSMQIGQAHFLLVYHLDNLEVWNRDSTAANLQFPIGKTLQKITASSGVLALSNLIAVSNNGESILLGNRLYDFKNKKLWGTLPVPPEHHLNLKDLKASCFFNDNKHIAVAYQEGDVLIFEVEKRNSKKRLMLVKSSFGVANLKSGITSIAIDKKANYIFTGNDDGSICKWKIGQLNKNDTFPPPEILSGHEGAVNCIAVSPGADRILTGSNDYSAILWDTAGKRLSTLKVRKSKVKYVNFSDSGNVMITGSEDGRVYLWKRLEALNLGKDTLAKFCPFDYYATGLNQYNVNGLYNATSVKGRLISTLHYLSNLPEINSYPEDPYYTGSLNKAIAEVDSMYGALMNNKRYLDSIEPLNKLVLFNYYLNFKKRQLFQSGKSETEEAKYLRLGIFYDTLSKTLLYNTIDIDEARSIATQYGELSNDFFEVLKKRPTGVKFSQRRIDLLEKFNMRYPNDSALRQDLSFAYWELSWQQIVIKNYENTIQYAKKGYDIYPGNNGIKTNLALGYLLSKNFARADSIYKTYKGKKYANNKAKDFTESFLQDLQDLEDMGIITPKNPEIYSKVVDIRTFLRKN